MDVLVAYDVATDTKAGERRLRQVAQICKDFGQRVQKSVFECSVNDMQLEQLRHRLLQCMDQQKDSLRIYRLVEPRERYVEVYGKSDYVDFDAPLVV
ncbi:MAG: CRISPR-associated endonuclease Cas2 [Acidobacteriota bacterium]|nr:CRISPR-associated endonuclease Cas2 [Blastocatellia bacterium]MDW8241105.1 CRISPR-associated endonuclease Cas2 [Acidobacteriota bacterium]